MVPTWITEHNERRPYQGRWCFGKTSMGARFHVPLPSATRIDRLFTGAWRDLLLPRLFNGAILAANLLVIWRMLAN